MLYFWKRAPLPPLPPCSKRQGGQLPPLPHRFRRPCLALICENNCGQKKIDHLYEILNTPLVIEGRGSGEGVSPPQSEKILEFLIIKCAFFIDNLKNEKKLITFFCRLTSLEVWPVNLGRSQSRRPEKEGGSREGLSPSQNIFVK